MKMRRIRTGGSDAHRTVEVASDSDTPVNVLWDILWNAKDKAAREAARATLAGMGLAEEKPAASAAASEWSQAPATAWAQAVERGEMLPPVSVRFPRAFVTQLESLVASVRTATFPGQVATGLYGYLLDENRSDTPEGRRLNSYLSENQRTIAERLSSLATVGWPWSAAETIYDRLGRGEMDVQPLLNYVGWLRDQGADLTVAPAIAGATVAPAEDNREGELDRSFEINYEPDVTAEQPHEPDVQNLYPPRSEIFDLAFRTQIVRLVGGYVPNTVSVESFPRFAAIGLYAAVPASRAWLGEEGRLSVTELDAAREMAGGQRAGAARFDVRMQLAETVNERISQHEISGPYFERYVRWLFGRARQRGGAAGAAEPGAATEEDPLERIYQPMRQQIARTIEVLYPPERIGDPDAAVRRLVDASVPALTSVISFPLMAATGLYAYLLGRSENLAMQLERYLTPAAMAAAPRIVREEPAGAEWLAAVFVRNALGTENLDPRRFLAYVRWLFAQAELRPTPAAAAQPPTAPPAGTPGRQIPEEVLGGAQQMAQGMGQVASLVQFMTWPQEPLPMAERGRWFMRAVAVGLYRYLNEHSNDPSLAEQVDPVQAWLWSEVMTPEDQADVHRDLTDLHRGSVSRRVEERLLRREVSAETVVSYMRLLQRQLGENEGRGRQASGLPGRIASGPGHRTKEIASDPDTLIITLMDIIENSREPDVVEAALTNISLPKELADFYRNQERERELARNQARERELARNRATNWIPEPFRQFHRENGGDLESLEFELADGLYWYCSDWHGGGGSEEYQVMGQIGYTPGALEGPPVVGEGAEEQDVEGREVAAQVYHILENGEAGAQQALDYFEAMRERTRRRND